MPRPVDPTRRAAIIQAARQLFATSQYAQTSMADIAATARMGVGSLYVYFPTKEAIALTLVDDYFSALYQAIVPPLRDQSGATAITNAIAASLQCAAQNQDVLALCRLVLPHHSIPARQRLQLDIEKAVTAQVQHGYFRQHDPRFITQWVDGQIAWIISQCFFEKQGSIDDFQQQVTDVIVQALCTSPSDANEVHRMSSETKI